MTDGRDVAEWGEHAQELVQQNYVLFRDEEVVARPIGPSVEDLKWLRSRVQPGRVLDLGCNVGLFSGLFGMQGVTYVGLDQSMPAARLHPRTVVVGNGIQLPFSTDTFNMVFTRAVLQHNCIGNDKNKIIQEMHRVLRPNGYYMCYEGSLLSHQDFPNLDTQSRDEAERWFGPLGFELLEHPTPHLYLFRRL